MLLGHIYLRFQPHKNGLHFYRSLCAIYKGSRWVASSIGDRGPPGAMIASGSGFRGGTVAMETEDMSVMVNTIDLQNTTVALVRGIMPKSSVIVTQVC